MIDLGTVIYKMGLRGATSHRTYELMVETWIDPSEPIPTFDECVEKWNELVAAGYFEPPYYVKRAEAYAIQGIYLQDIIELTSELIMATAANNLDDIEKYTQILAELHEKRRAIKNEIVKPQ